MHLPRRCYHGDASYYGRHGITRCNARVTMVAIVTNYVAKIIGVKASDQEMNS